MKLIKAYVREIIVDNLVRAIHHEHVRHVTAVEVRGLVMGGDSAVTESIDSRVGKYEAMVMVEHVCDDDALDEVVAMIRSACHTGYPGDGLIVVTEVTDCVSVRTGETGSTALLPRGSVVDLGAAGGRALDPVCGMDISRAASSAQFRYEGTLYYFCTESCRRRFTENPDAFLE